MKKIEEEEKVSFRKRSIEERRKKFEEIKNKNPELIPVIFESNAKSNLPSNIKLTAKKDLKFSKIVENYRKNGKIDPSQSIFFYSEDRKSLSQNSTIGEIYKNHKNKEDSFLYIRCNEVETLGH